MKKERDDFTVRCEGLQSERQMLKEQVERLSEQVDKLSSRKLMVRPPSAISFVMSQFFLDDSYNELVILFHCCLPQS